MDSNSFNKEFDRLAQQEIIMERINEYIHAFSFPFHDLLLNYKDIIIEEFKKVQLPTYDDNSSANFPSNFKGMEDINGFFPNYIHYIVDKFYLTDKIYPIQPNFGLYVQDGDKNINVFHNHLFTPNVGSMVATFYLNPPKEGDGGELEFMLHQANKFQIPVKKNKIYFFPNWLLHTPKPQNNKDYRICFNYTIQGSRKPLNIKTGDIW